MKRVATRALAATLLICGGASLSADRGKEGQSAAKVVTLETRDLADLAGSKEALMLTVEYPPAGASTPHRHDAHVFVYVLEGSIVMQVDGREPVTLREGETFYESPQDVHRTSRNASASEPAKFLVFFVKDKGKPAELIELEGEDHWMKTSSSSRIRTLTELERFLGKYLGTASAATTSTN